MELKDVILSTLAEIEEIGAPSLSQPQELTRAEPQAVRKPEMPTERLGESVVPSSGKADEEVRMLEGIRERLLVLFEGFQSPNNVQIEAKVDLTLNFLEYLLATIDGRLETIKGDQE